jgi:2Fe-2S ferredoxin
MKVKFVPQNIELAIEPDQSVMELAHKHGIKIHSICNGVPSCAECRVRVVEGDYNVLPPASKEVQLIGTAHFLDQRRLSCQLVCFGDITVDLTEQIQKEAEEGKKKRQKAGVRQDAESSQARTGNLVDDTKIPGEGK